MVDSHLRAEGRPHWQLEPMFLAGSAGLLHATLFAAAQPSPATILPDAILIAPPFAEEMNKCRPMLGALAKEMAGNGQDVLLVDLFGTGDSGGDFSDATWEQWGDDLATAWRWLVARGAQRIHVVAVRSGALLIAPLVRRFDVSQSTLVLWQPVLRGADYWRQFLRLRIAADALRDTRDAISPQAQLDRDNVIEIAGYTISAKLASAMSASALEANDIGRFADVLWAEVSLSDPPTLAPLAQRALTQWREQGVRVDSIAVSGEAFWTTPEIGRAPELIAVTRKRLSTRQSTIS